MSRRGMMVSASAGVSLPGPWMWLKAGAGFFTDAGSTACTTTGDLIEQWSDASGNGRHATQATSGNRPTYDATGINSLPVANFLATSSQWFLLPSMTGITSEGEAFIAVKAAADPPASRVGSGLWFLGPGTTSWDAAYPFSDGIVYDDALHAGGVTVGNLTPLLTDVHVYHASGKSGDSQTFFLDNVSLTTASSGSVWPGSMPASPMIGQTRTGAAFLSGTVAEFQFFDSQLSPTDRGNVVADIRSRLAF